MSEKNRGRDADILQIDSFRKKRDGEPKSAINTSASEVSTKTNDKEKATDTLPANTVEIIPLFTASLKLMRFSKAEGVVSPKVYGEWRVTLQKETAQQIADRVDNVTEDVAKKNPAYVRALYDEVLRKISLYRVQQDKE